jgi:integrase
MSLNIRKRKGVWHARGVVPARQPSGKIVNVRIERSLRTERKAEAAAKAADLARYYHDLAYGKIKAGSPSFAKAVKTYLQTRGKDDRFVDRLLNHFKETPIDQIDQEAISRAAHILYPGCKASTQNRAVYDPVTAILRLSGVRPDYKRPKQDRRPLSIPSNEWFDAVIPHSSPRLAALLVFLTLTGRRITEALEAIDNGDGTATIERTKSGKPLIVVVPAMVHRLLGRSVHNTRLWTYGCRQNARRELVKVCAKAGVPLYGFHALGRHAFATRLLKQGKSLKFVADAGGWASIRIPAQHYLHLEQSEVQEDVRKVGEEWLKKRTL